MEKTDGIAFGIVRAERIRADELGKIAGLMSIGGPLGSHLVKRYGDARPRDLPRRLAPREPAADDVNAGLFLGHGPI